MKTYYKKSDELRIIQDFIDEKYQTHDTAVDQLTVIKDALAEGKYSQDLWQRVLLVGLKSRREDIRRICGQYYTDMFQDENAKQSINDLLSFTMEDYKDSGHVRSDFIRVIRTELSVNRQKFLMEPIKFMLNLRRIFEVSFPKGFAEECVRCLFMLINDNEKDSSRALGKIAAGWITDALRTCNAPKITESVIKRELGRQSFEKVDCAFVDNVSRGLQTTTSPDRLIDSLNLLEKWYQQFSYNKTPYCDELLTELKIYNRNATYKIDENIQRVLFANSKILNDIVEIINEWPENAKVCKAAINVVNKLPAARQLISAKEEEKWPKFLVEFRNTKKQHIFQIGLDYISEFTSGLTVNMENESTEKISKDESNSYRQRLCRINRWAGLESDRVVIAWLLEIMSDIDSSLERRKSAAACLFKINPSNIHDLLAGFALNNPSTNPLIPDLLAMTLKLDSWEVWKFCAHYFEIFSNKKPCPFLQILMEAAAKTGNAEMINVLIPYVFDSEEPHIRNQAERALRSSGYGIFIDREALSRTLQKLANEKDDVFAKLQRLYEDTNKRIYEKMGVQIDIETNRSKQEEQYLELKLQITRYQAFATGKMVDLSIIDKQLKELTERIDHLTRRKIKLEAQMALFIDARNNLTKMLHSLKSEIDINRRNRENASKQLSNFQNQLNSLKNNRVMLQQQFDSSVQELSDVTNEQNRLNRSRGQDYNKLQDQKSRLEYDINSLSEEIREMDYQLSNNIDEMNSLIDELNRVNRQLSFTNYDDPSRRNLINRRDRARSEINGIKRDNSRVKRQRNRQYIEIDNRNRNINKINKESNNLARHIRASEEVAASASNNVDVARTNLQNCDRDIEETQYKIHSVSQELNSIQNAIERLEIEAAKLRNEIDDLIIKEKKIERDMLPVIHDLEEAKREYERINAKMIKEEEIIRKEKKRVDAIQKRLTSDLEVSRSRFEELSKQASNIHKSIEFLESENTKCNNSFNEIVQKIKDNKKKMESLIEISEKAIIEKNREAYTRTCLNRLEKDRYEMDKLEYGRAMALAADTFARSNE